MSLIDAVIFGMVQGITEFLPISSTAHIVITELLLGYQFPGLAFEIFLHLASVLAVCLYFRKELLLVMRGFFAYPKNRSHENAIQFYFGLYIMTATMITGILGLFLKGCIGDAMKGPAFISFSLVATGSFLVIVERIRTYGKRTEGEMTFLDALMVGLGQTVAILPGISRSGATLVTALWIGLSRETAVRFSFLLAIPVILGSSVLMLDDVTGNLWSDIGITDLAASFAVTFIFSWIGIVWLITFLRKSRLIYFAAYCFVLAVLVYFFVEPTTVF